MLTGLDHSYKYLGVTLDQSLNYIDHLNKIYKKASSKVKLLSKVLNDMSTRCRNYIQNDDIANLSLLQQHLLIQQSS